MITLSILGYLIISSLITLTYKTTSSYSYLSHKDVYPSWKESVEVGFGMIPLIGIAIGLFVGFIWLCGAALSGVLWLIMWIAENMP